MADDIRSDNSGERARKPKETVMTAIICLTIIVVALLLTDGSTAVVAAISIGMVIAGLAGYKGREMKEKGP